LPQTRKPNFAYASISTLNAGLTERKATLFSIHADPVNCMSL
jgi:hypothetical protein